MSQRRELLDAQSMLSDSAEDDSDYSVQGAQERLKRKKFRRGLCICTTVLALIFVFAGAAVVGFVVVSTRHHHTESTSPTPSYSTANSTVLDYIDTSYDPCENFYEYSCGQWSSNRPGAAEWGTFYELALDNYNKLAGYLSRYESRYDPTAIKKAKRIYSACTDTDYISDHLTDQIESFMVSAGGWDEVDYTPAHSWSINSNLYNDHYLGSSAFFSFGITPDDLNSSKPVIRVRVECMCLLVSYNMHACYAYMHITAFPDIGGYMWLVAIYMHETTELLGS